MMTAPIQPIVPPRLAAVGGVGRLGGCCPWLRARNSRRRSALVLLSLSLPFARGRMEVDPFSRLERGATQMGSTPTRKDAAHETERMKFAIQMGQQPRRG